MQAVILAGGNDPQMRPLVIERPQAMIHLINKPVLSHILDLLKKHNITEVIFSVQYLADMIQDYFEDGTRFGMKFRYIVAEDSLGTFGSLKNVQAILKDTFLVISGHILTNINLTELIQYHKSAGRLVTIALHSILNPVDHEVVTIDRNGLITHLEKLSRGVAASDYVNTGIYVLEPKILDYVPDNTPVDFTQDLFQILLQQGHSLNGHVVEDYWCDISNITEYIRATTDALEGKISDLDLGRYKGDGIWAEQDVEISPNARLEGPIYLGHAVQIKSGAMITGPTVIRDYSVIDNEAEIDRAIIWRNCYIGERARVRGAVILRQSALKANSTVFEEAVIGDGTIIGDGATIHAGVKIWPGKEVEPGATVKRNIIWGSQGRRVLFGRYGVTGVTNIDLTPEFSARLASAYGATLPKGALVTFSRDPHPSPLMLMRSAMGGLPSSGISVLDLGVQPIPVARYFSRVSSAMGGVHFCLSPFDERVVDVRFIDDQGLNISKEVERQIEHLFFREDFRRVFLDDIGRSSNALRVRETYMEGFLRATNVKAIQEAKFNLVVDYASDPIVDILPDLLDALNCTVIALNANIFDVPLLTQSKFQTALKHLQIITTASRAQLGARLNPGGERIFLVDDRGYLLTGTTVCAAMVELTLRDTPGSTVAIPIDQPNLFEIIAKQHGGRIIRTEVNMDALIEATCSEKIIMAGDGRGNFIFPGFHCAVDGMMALVKMLEFLATQKVFLGDVVSNLPPYYIVERKVSCIWEAKARVMRLINERFESYKTPTISGVKINLDSNRWILIMPDPDQPYFRVVVEASSLNAADTLADEYAQIIEKLSPSE